MEGKVESGEFRVEYGAGEIFRDVTYAALQTCFSSQTMSVVIPASDEERAVRFGDPLVGILKVLRIQNPDGSLSTFDHTQSVEAKVPPSNVWCQALARLSKIHSSLKLRHGGFHEEFPEQAMAAAFITPNAKVLELGANVGRNTLVIAALLSDPSNLVTMECDPVSYALLLENRDENVTFFKTKTFHAENSALSSIPLMQKGWDTVPVLDSVIPADFQKVGTITFTELQAKYNIVFDTLVADCEGALFHILQQDAPSILYKITKIILENDFHVFEHKKFVDQTFMTFGFRRIYSQAGPWGPSANCFYEVWSK